MERVFPVLLTIVAICILIGGTTFFQHDTGPLFDIVPMTYETFAYNTDIFGNQTRVGFGELVGLILNSIRDITVLPTTAIRLIGGLHPYECDSLFLKCWYVFQQTDKLFDEVLKSPKEYGDGEWYSYSF